MMRKLTLPLLLLLAIVPCATGLAQDVAIAQDTIGVAINATPVKVPQSENEIMFGVRVPEKSDLSYEVMEILENKTTQILGRCGAGASGKQDPFVVEPVLSMNDAKSSEGLVRNVTSISGELSLSARHRYTDAVFYTTTVPLTAVAKGNNTDQMQLLAKSIKPSDAVFVRFVRNARKKVFDYGLLHPEIYGIPDAPADTVVLVVPVAVIPDNTNPVPQEDSPEISLPPAPVPGGECEIFFSYPGFKADLVRCEYDPALRSIHFVMKITNIEKVEKHSIFTGIARGIDSEGNKYKDFKMDESYHDFPYGVPVTLHGYIKGVYSNPGIVPYLQVTLGDCRMELRNMIVNDKQR